jgi:hypothetical protein
LSLFTVMPLQEFRSSPGRFEHKDNTSIISAAQRLAWY